MAKYQINWAEKAKIDLLEILEFYKNRNGNTKYSRKVNSEINSCIAQISKNPKIGIETQVYNVRYFIVKDYEKYRMKILE